LVAGAVVLALVVLGVVGHRNGWFFSENDRLGDTIRFALPQDGEGQTTQLDLDKLVEGDWDRLVISCYGHSFGQVEDALQNSVKGENRSEIQTATVILYFVDDETRTMKVYNRDADIMAEPVYFEPCVKGGEYATEPLVFDRSDTNLSMVWDERGARWELAGDE
jgi:hypothetical protein